MKKFCSIASIFVIQAGVLWHASMPAKALNVVVPNRAFPPPPPNYTFVLRVNAGGGVVIELEGGKKLPASRNLKGSLELDYLDGSNNEANGMFKIIPGESDDGNGSLDEPGPVRGLLRETANKLEVTNVPAPAPILGALLALRYSKRLRAKTRKLHYPNKQTTASRKTAIG